MPRPADARDRILETAAKLFARDGYRAVGVDRIVAESGVAKMTLYRHFPSKDDLIAAYLHERADWRFRWLERITEGADPRTALETIMDEVGELATSPEFQGCAFLASAAEFPELDHPGHFLAQHHKTRIIEFLESLAAAAGVPDPRGLAEDLLLVMDGAWSASRVFGEDNHGRRAGAMGRALIAAALAQRVA